MCQSVAEGGRRCQAHMRQGVSQQMVAFATAVAPVTFDQARAALADLEREGVDLLDPSREEVDAFLEQAVQQARFEPGLTESRRERIIRHLREAIGKVLPSGATFHAWKNILAEAWQRSRRRAGVFFAAGLVTFSGGCGFTTTNQPPPNPDITYSAAAADQVVAAVAVDEDAADKFGGNKSVRDAYAVGADLLLDVQGNDRLIGMKRGDLNQANTNAVREAMTPDCRALWDQALEDAASDRQENDSINALVLHDLPGIGVSYESPGQAEVPLDVRQSGKRIVNKRITSAHASVDDDGRLKIRQQLNAEVRMQAANGDPYVAPMGADVTLWYEQVDGGWKIDGWFTNWNSQPVRPGN